MLYFLVGLLAGMFLTTLFGFVAGALMAGGRADDAEYTGDELPDWDDLRGRAPDATGGKPSEVFVRELRNSWGE